MRDSFQMKTDVRGLINVPSIITLLGTGGKIFADERTPSRQLFTDIVINALGITNSSIQKGAGNINVYVPVDATSKLPDQTKMQTLSRAIVALIDEQYKTDFQTWVEDSPGIYQDTDGGWFVNIPFRYQAIQNYTNI